MRRLILATLCAALALPGAALADKDKGKARDKPEHAAKLQRVAPAGVAAIHCPPGLAKKPVPCMPPGQARKAHAKTYAVGEILPGDFVRIPDPGRYGLGQGHYVRLGDYIYRIDDDTREVLNLVGAVADILD